MELQQQDILFLPLLIFFSSLFPPHKVNSVAKEDKDGLSAFSSLSFAISTQISW